MTTKEEELKGRRCVDCKRKMTLIITSTGDESCLTIYPPARLKLCNNCWNKRLIEGTLGEVK